MGVYDGFVVILLQRRILWTNDHWRRERPWIVVARAPVGPARASIRCGRAGTAGRVKRCRAARATVPQRSGL